METNKLFEEVYISKSDIGLFNVNQMYKFNSRIFYISYMKYYHITEYIHCVIFFRSRFFFNFLHFFKHSCHYFSMQIRFPTFVFLVSFWKKWTIGSNFLFERAF